MRRTPINSPEAAHLYMRLAQDLLVDILSGNPTDISILSNYGNTDLHGIQWMPCVRSLELTETNLTDVFNLCMCRRPIRFKASADVLRRLYSLPRMQGMLSIIADNIVKQNRRCT